MTLDEATKAIVDAIADDTKTTTVIAACGMIAGRLLAAAPEPARRGMVELFVDNIYRSALALQRRQSA